MLARRSILILKVGVLYRMKLAIFVASYSQDKALLAVYITAKDVSVALHQ